MRHNVDAPLPSSKQEALELIDLMGKEIKSLMNIGDLMLMAKRYEERADLIRQFFDRYGKKLTAHDLTFFKDIQHSDKDLMLGVVQQKTQINQEFSGKQKQKKRIHIYTNISKQR